MSGGSGLHAQRHTVHPGTGVCRLVQTVDWCMPILATAQPNVFSYHQPSSVADRASVVTGLALKPKRPADDPRLFILGQIAAGLAPWGIYDPRLLLDRCLLVLRKSSIPQLFLAPDWVPRFTVGASFMLVTRFESAWLNITWRPNARAIQLDERICKSKDFVSQNIIIVWPSIVVSIYYGHCDPY